MKKRSSKAAVVAVGGVETLRHFAFLMLFAEAPNLVLFAEAPNLVLMDAYSV